MKKEVEEKCCFECVRMLTHGVEHGSVEGRDESRVTTASPERLQE